MLVLRSPEPEPQSLDRQSTPYSLREYPAEHRTLFVTPSFLPGILKALADSPARASFPCLVGPLRYTLLQYGHTTKLRRGSWSASYPAGGNSEDENSKPRKALTLALWVEHFHGSYPRTVDERHPYVVRGL